MAYVVLAVALPVVATLGESPEERAAALVSKMTLEEKVAMLHGPPTGPCCQCKVEECAYVGNVVGNKRLGIPPVNMNDGPQGFRDNQNPATTTAWPSGLTMAATWSVEAMLEWGDGMGKEFYNKGANVQLGPGLCLARVPRNGRNFEYLSGEDPYLGYKLVQPVIKGIQQNKVVANAKHYVMNNQETNRGAVDELVDERTRFEMYYPPFIGASHAGVGSVMCSYNKIGNTTADARWSCENPATLGRDLKERIGFKGWVMSDWGATHSTSIAAGLDQEMPAAKYMGEGIFAGIKAGNVTVAQVDASVKRILTAFYAVGVMDAEEGAYSWEKLKHNVTTESSVASARRLAAEAHVLLKNDDKILPLKKVGQTIAAIGLADDSCVVHGGGSGSVTPSFISTPLDGISRVSKEVTFNEGFSNLAAAAAAAQAADVAVVFVGTLSHEGGDRASLSLDDGGPKSNQNALIDAVAGANPNTIVVMATPGAVLMPWINKVKAVVTNFMPGQQAGNAIADVLFGEVNPSGKLPLTFPNRENETEFTPAQWPGLPDPANPEYARYSEKLLVGYRWYDYHNKSFTTGRPFGFGLSYTTFDLHIASCGCNAVEVVVKNTGSRPGAEVVQLYISFPGAGKDGEPIRHLRSFEKTPLIEAGSEHSIHLNNTDESWYTRWNAAVHQWSRPAGPFKIMVGTSSRNVEHACSCE